MKSLNDFISHHHYKTVSFQGSLGAWSHLACRQKLEQLTALPCPHFEGALEAVEKGEAELAMLPIDNSIAGRVADVHALLPASRLFIVGEYYLPIEHHLLGLKDAELSDITTVHSHIHALNQCRKNLRRLNIAPVIDVDTAGSAKKIAAQQDKSIAAIASSLAGEIYGLKSLKANIADGATNVTRFVILSREPLNTSLLPAQGTITSFLFEARNIPSALYKALGGFATNGINLTRIESYLHMSEKAEFWIDAEGHSGQAAFDNAIEELRFFSTNLRIFGSYEASPYRKDYTIKKDDKA